MKEVFDKLKQIKEKITSRVSPRTLKLLLLLLITAAVPLTMLVAQNTNDIRNRAQTLPATPPEPPSPTPIPITWIGQYYTYQAGDVTKGLNGTPVLTRQDAAIDFNWGSGSPAANIPSDRFSVRWTRTENFPAGSYLITVRHNDGMRIYLDGVLVYNRWSNQTASTRTLTRTVPQGGVHTLIVEYYEHQGLAEAQVTWVKQ